MFGGTTRTLNAFGCLPCEVYVHQILQGMAVPGDALVWGTMEIRHKGSGRAGSEKGKFLQLYSPLAHLIKSAGNFERMQPDTMRALRCRKKGILMLVDTVLSNIDKAGGVRLEVRLHHGSKHGSAHDVLMHGHALLQKVLHMIGADIHIKKIPVAFYKEFLQKELAAAFEKKVFCGMSNNGPNRNDPEQVALFRSKVMNW